jgi:hypothetical protein
MQAPFSEYLKITAASFAKLRVLEMPSAWRVGDEIKDLDIELLDMYNNRLDCRFGECTRPWYGFPQLVGKRDWPLLESSDLVVSVSLDHARMDNFTPAPTDEDRACGERPRLVSTTLPRNGSQTMSSSSMTSPAAGSNFLATVGSCRCLSGSLSAQAVEGVARLDCLSVGMAGLSFPLVLSAGGLHLPLAPLNIHPGTYQALYVTQEPPADENVAGEPVLYCPLSGCLGLSVQMVDKCGNFLAVSEDEEVDVDVSVCPEEAGLSGTRRVKTVRGRATFTDLAVSRAGNMPCELVDSVHFWEFESSPCMQRRDSYVFTFTSPGISVVSSSFFVQNGPMRTLEIVQQPGSNIQGRALAVQPQVKLVDAFANTITQDPGGGFVVQAAMVTGEGCKRADQPQCWSNCDGTAIGGTCYKYFALPSTFDQAVAACKNWGGELLTVTSAKTNLDVLAPITGGVLSWIGLKWEADRVPEPDWIWRDVAGSDTGDYANWADGHPPLADQAVTGCVAAEASRWKALSCNLKLPFVCGNDASDEAQNECNCCSKISGHTTGSVRGGFAVFTDLLLAGEPGIGLRMIFSVMPVSQQFGANIFCQGPCGCKELRMATNGAFVVGPGEYRNSMTCQWMISTMATVPGGLRDTRFGEVEISLAFTSFDTEPAWEVMGDVVTINDCTSEQCPDPVLVAKLDGNEATHSGPTAVRLGTKYVTYTGFMQLVFTTDLMRKDFEGFRAEWSVRKRPSTKVTAPPPAWQRATAISEQFSIAPRTSSLHLSQQPFLAAAGQALVRQPRLTLLDSTGGRVRNEPINISVSIVAASPRISISGTTQITSVDGLASFTDLEINIATSLGLQLLFTAQSGSPAIPMTVLSDVFSVFPGAASLFVVHNTQPPPQIRAGATLADVMLILHDSEGYRVLSSNVAVAVKLEGAASHLMTPGGASFPPILGETQQTALNGTVTFDHLRISWATKSTALVFSAPHIGLSAVSQS